MRFSFRNLVISFFLILGCYTSKAQENEENINLIYVDALPLLIPPNRLSIGYMRSIHKNYFIGLEIGSSIDSKHGRIFSNTSDYKLFSYRIQAGYIFNPDRKAQNYLSIDFLKIHHTETLYDDYFKSTSFDEIGNSIYYKYDTINYKRKRFSINLNYGFFAFFNTAQTFGINPSFGLGVKFIDVTFSEGVNLKERDFPSNFLNFGSSYRLEGREVGLNLNLQLKFFYKF